MIGAGIVGLSAAYHLHADGHRVTVVDRDLDGDGASSGNAGGIGISEIVPVSVPGLIWRVPGWLLDPLGPLVGATRTLARLVALAVALPARGNSCAGGANHSSSRCTHGQLF